LYKRCFPKWASVWDGGLVGAPKLREIEDAAEAREDTSRVRFEDVSTTTATGAGAADVDMA
jgi:hypothetical protein